MDFIIGIRAAFADASMLGYAALFVVGMTLIVLGLRARAEAD